MDSKSILKKAWELQYRIENRVKKDKIKYKDVSWNFRPWSWSRSRWFEFTKVMVWSWIACHHMAPVLDWPFIKWILWANYIIISLLVVFCFSYDDLNLLFEKSIEARN